MKNLDKTFSWGFLLMKIVRAIVTVLCQYKGWFAWQNSNSVDSALATLRHCHPKNKLFSPEKGENSRFHRNSTPCQAKNKNSLHGIRRAFISLSLSIYSLFELEMCQPL